MTNKWNIDSTHSGIDFSIRHMVVSKVRGRFVFDVEQFPELRFRSKRIERLGPSHFRVLGDLTIRDITREVPLDVAYGGQATDPWGNERAGFVAKALIDRKDFGLRWNQVLEAGGLLVGDRVDIELEVQAMKASAAQAA